MDINKLKVFQNANGEVVTTSLIIAKDTNQSHKKVMENIREWVGTLKGRTYKDSQGKEQPYYELDKYQFMLYAMHKKGYDDWKQQIVQEYKDMEQYIIKTDQINKFKKFRKEEKRETYDFYNLIGHSGKCIALSKCLYNITSYKFNLPFKHNKEQIVALAEYHINDNAYEFYVDMKEKAEKFVETFMAIDEEHFMKPTMNLLIMKYVDNVDKFNEYCNTHNEKDLEFTIDMEQYYGKSFGMKKIYIPKNI